jgi:hypothetical protein
MAKVERLRSVVAALKARQVSSQKDDATSVQVGYTTEYALYVHENLEAHHTVGQAKFLEQPAREMSAELARIVETAIKGGASVPQALLLAGLRLQAVSQKLVPVDTGALKNSAFTKLVTPG